MLALIIPLHNEETALPRLLHELKDVRTLLNDQLKVVMVDDASTDATGMILHTLEEEQWITVLRSASRQGQHRSLFFGIEEALQLDHISVVGTMDADMDPPPREFIDLLPHLARHDLVIARRRNRPRPLFRRAVSLLLIVLCWMLRPNRIRDHGSMFRLYSVDLCRRCLRFRDHGEFLAGVSLLAAESPVEILVTDSSSVARSSRYSSRIVCEAGIQMLRLLVHHPFRLFRSGE